MVEQNKVIKSTFQLVVRKLVFFKLELLPTIGTLLNERYTKLRYVMN